MRAHALQLVVLSLVACGARPTPVKQAPLGDDITLYRDIAVIRQRVVVDVPAVAATVHIAIAAGVRPDQVLVLDRGGATIRAVHGAIDPAADDHAGALPAAFDPRDPDVDDPLDTHGDEPDDDGPHDDEAGGDDDEEARVRAAPETGTPTELELDVEVPHAGKYAFVIGYPTTRLAWDAAYTITTTPARDRGELRGALAIRNTTGVVLRAASARLVDAELGTWRARSSEHLATALTGGSEPSTPQPRELGTLVLALGETRVELLAPAARTMRSVLVYDPIGTRLDNPGAAPLRDFRLGLDIEKSPRVSESFEIARDAAASAGLPAGTVRLIERRAGGALVVLGEAHLFEATARVADVDTIAIGTADGVTGARERRELTVDDDNRRIVEEIVITLDNQRPHPAQVLVREHLYRGQNWTLAYHSAATAAKEGAQQIALRAEVPARGQLKILYVVVYTWGP